MKPHKDAVFGVSELVKKGYKFGAITSLSEDVYAGIEWESGAEGAAKLIQFLKEEMGVDKIRFPNTSGIGIKPISIEGTNRIVRSAINYAIQNNMPSVTLVHKGNIMKFTEGGFRDWGYALAKDEFGAVEIDG